jgi:hypothetical protein
MANPPKPLQNRPAGARRKPPPQGACSWSACSSSFLLRYFFATVLIVSRSFQKSSQEYAPLPPQATPAVSPVPTEPAVQATPGEYTNALGNAG